MQTLFKTYITRLHFVPDQIMAENIHFRAAGFEHSIACFWQYTEISRIVIKSVIYGIVCDALKTADSYKTFSFLCCCESKQDWSELTLACSMILMERAGEFISLPSTTTHRSNVWN